MVVTINLAVRANKNKKAKNNRKLKKKSISRASNPGTGRSMSRRDRVAFIVQHHGKISVFLTKPLLVLN